MMSGKIPDRQDYAKYEKPSTRIRHGCPIQPSQCFRRPAKQFGPYRYQHALSPDQTRRQMASPAHRPENARILLAAKKHDCMAEILVIASALSIQDPRERPLEARDAAAKAHERFTDKQSDFLAYLNIWDSFQHERDQRLVQQAAGAVVPPIFPVTPAYA